MFNYANLNDVEFEELAKDVVGRMLNVSLRSFAQGKDGGIDLTDNVSTKDIVVQVRHYKNSSFSDLRRSFKKEMVNIEELSPQQYYICCSKELTPENVRELYEMFLGYMKSDKNIITLKEINDFLSKDENEDIIRKHFKLWLEATNVINEILNRNIFIDCEILVSDLRDEEKFFVKTSIYEQCVNVLEKNCALILIGLPGVGKSITSNMLVLNFIAKGYKVKYTTNGNISDLKKSITANKDSKEIILLDDCLGQLYFNLKSETENELVSLIKYVNMNKNKVLILNSRVTIYNQAKCEFEEFNRVLQNKKLNIYEINMDEISLYDKARIFYNHLYFKNIKKEYFEDIKRNKNYLKILRHKNYNPRIIDHVTVEANYLHVKPESYSEYILKSLDNPKDIWKNEYTNRLKEVDRIFLTTLYSLTDTEIDISILKSCFEKRLAQKNKDIDTSLNQFEIIMERLNQSLISIVDFYGRKHVRVINPSVNDFLKIELENNNLEKEALRSSINCLSQIERLYNKEEQEEVLAGFINNHKAFELLTINDAYKSYKIVSIIAKKLICDEAYKDTVKDYFTYFFVYGDYHPYENSRHILRTFIKQPLKDFYGIKIIFYNEIQMRRLFSCLNFQNVAEVIKEIYIFYKMDSLGVPVWFIPFARSHIRELNEDFILKDLNVADYCPDDIEFDEDGIDYNSLNSIVEDINDTINSNFSKLPDGFMSSGERFYVETTMIEDEVNSYYENSDINQQSLCEEEFTLKDIEYMFERDLGFLNADFK